MKINLGCGKRKGAGYIGVDLARDSEADILADIAFLPLRPRIASRIKVYSVFEHLREPERALKEIKRVLKSGGLLIATIAYRNKNPSMFNLKHFLYNFPLSLLHLKSYARITSKIKSKDPSLFHYWKISPGFFKDFQILRSSTYYLEYVYRSLRVGRKKRLFSWIKTPSWSSQLKLVMRLKKN